MDLSFYIRKCTSWYLFIYQDNYQVLVIFICHVCSLNNMATGAPVSLCPSANSKDATAAALAAPSIVNLNLNNHFHTILLHVTELVINFIIQSKISQSTSAFTQGD